MPLAYGLPRPGYLGIENVDSRLNGNESTTGHVAAQPP